MRTAINVIRQIVWWYRTTWRAESRWEHARWAWRVARQTVSRDGSRLPF